MSVPPNIQALFRDHVNARAEQLQLEVRTTLEQSRTPKPSSPGNPPARDTGRLMESLRVLKRATATDATALVGHDANQFTRTGPYPAFLEYGTRKMAARPFWRPSVDRFRKRYG